MQCLLFPRRVSSLDTGSVMRTWARSDRNDDQSLRSPFPGDERWPIRISVWAERAVQAELRVRQVWRIEHHVRREMYDLTFRIGCKVLPGEHVVNARFRRGLENAFCKCIRHEELDLVGAFSL